MIIALLLPDLGSLTDQVRVAMSLFHDDVIGKVPSLSLPLRPDRKSNVSNRPSHRDHPEREGREREREIGFFMSVNSWVKYAIEYLAPFLTCPDLR